MHGPCPPSLRGQRRSGWTTTAATRLTPLRGRRWARTAEPHPGGESSAKLNSGTNYLIKGRPQMLGRDARRLATSHSAWGKLFHPPPSTPNSVASPCLEAFAEERLLERIHLVISWKQPGIKEIRRRAERI